MTPRIQALKFITRCLTYDSGPDSLSALRESIRSGRLCWEEVVSLANNQLLTPALWIALQNRGLDEELPEDLREYLLELHGLNKERNAHLRTQLLEAVHKLNDIDVTPVLLKGAMHLVADIYGDSGARIMTDIDLLVPHESVDRCVSALHELGYRPEPDSLADYPPQHHQYAPLYRSGGYGPVEIHRGLMEGFADMLSAETALTESEPLMFQGLSMKVLSPTHRALHNILHSQLVDHNHADGIVPLRSLYEVLTENRAASGRVDWCRIHSLMQRQNRGKVLQTYLYLAHRVFAMPLPRGIRKSPGCLWYYWRCHAQLAWQWAHVWGLRLGRFSTERIRNAYGCEDGWIALNRARLHEFAHRMTAYVRRRSEPNRNETRG